MGSLSLNKHYTTYNIKRLSSPTAFFVFVLRKPIFLLRKNRHSCRADLCATKKQVCEEHFYLLQQLLL